MYIFRRGCTYYFRWVVPQSLLLHFRVKEVKKSLHTSNRKEALRLARCLTVCLDQLQSKPSDMEHGNRAITHLTGTFIQHPDGSVEAKDVHLDPDKADAELKLLEGVMATIGAVAPAYPDQNRSTCRVPLSQLVKEYIEDGERAGTRNSKTVEELEYIFNLFVAVVGDRPLGTLSHEDTRKFKAAVLKLPKNRTKLPCYRDKTLDELLEMSIPNGDLLSSAAVNKHMNKVSGLLAFGVRQGYIPINYAARMALPKNTRDDEERDPYTDAELAKLKDAVLSTPFKKSYQRWVPLIGMYSAMRIEEICQLTLDDIKEEGGVLCFDVHERDDNHKVKTVHGRRLVPVHPKLLELGLQAYIDEVRGNGATRLFPELNRQRDGYSQTPSRWYNDRFLPKLGIGKTFHGLRHTGATRMREAEVPMDLISDIVGHSRSENETGRYAKAASAQRKLAALKKLTY